MIVKTRSSEALRALARCFKYRKHDIFVEDRDEITLQGGEWFEGSREAYALYTPPAKVEALRYPTDPQNFGGGAPPLFKIPRGSFVIRGGIFRGKKAHFTIYGIEAGAFFCGAGP